jgi:hypothetical protein
VPVLFSIAAYWFYRKHPVGAASYGHDGPENASNSAKQLVTRIIFAIPIGIIFIGILQFSKGYFNQGGLVAPNLSQLQEITGMMSKISMGKSWGIAVHNKINGERYTSEFTVCNYPSIANDFGKEVKALIFKGSTFNEIYQLEVDGITRVNYYNRVARDKKHLKNGIIITPIGLILLIIVGAGYYKAGRRKLS